MDCYTHFKFKLELWFKFYFPSTLLLLCFQLEASNFALSKKEPALPSVVPGEKCIKVQGAHLGYTASMSTVKPHDTQNTFSDLGPESCWGAKDRSRNTCRWWLSGTFSPRQASALLEANSQQTHHDSRQELKCHIWALISLYWIKYSLWSTLNICLSISVKYRWLKWV